jgi:hypothetical protein
MTALDDIVTTTVKEKPPASDFADKLIAEAGKGNGDGTGDEEVAGTSGETDSPRVQRSASASYAYMADSVRSEFDPAIHSVGKDGQPRRNKDGSFRRRKGAGRFGEVAAGTEGNRANNVGPDPGAREAARFAVGFIEMVGRTFFGDEWLPVIDPVKGVNEREMMTLAWTEFFEHYGIIEIPPWVGVIIVTGSYALPRLNKPNTAEKIGVIKARIQNWRNPKVG